ncbi:hypothetical protein F5B21DRAFT_497504 [Xylaria acuta]|nr:hypothetical protein F5B21DRAFT_497504 [Xylaria acuta]
MYVCQGRHQGSIRRLDGVDHHPNRPPRHDWFCSRNLGYGDFFNQQELVAETKVPTAVVVGLDEPHLGNSKIKSLKYGNLQSGRCGDIQGGQHCPLYELLNKFIPVLDKFVRDITG